VITEVKKIGYCYPQLSNQRKRLHDFYNLLNLCSKIFKSQSPFFGQKYSKLFSGVSVKGTVPTKTNMGQKWYQSTAYDLPLFRWIFFFKGLHSLKSKNENSALRGTLLVERPVNVETAALCFSGALHESYFCWRIF
jgi:hypothetical protein